MTLTREPRRSSTSRRCPAPSAPRSAASTSAAARRRDRRRHPRRAGSSARSCSSPASTSTPGRAPRVRRALRRADRRPPGDPRHRRPPRGLRDRLHEARPAATTSTATSADRARRHRLAHRRHLRRTAAARLDPATPSSSRPPAATRCSPTSRPPSRRSARRSRSFLATLTAVHDGSAPVRQVAAGTRRRRAASGRASSTPPSSPSSTRSSAPTPRPARKSLFVNPGFTSHIKELERAESDALLAVPLRARRPSREFTVRYHWHAGDLGFWDNRATQHAVVGDFGGQHRVIQRVTLRGDRPS